LVDADFGQPGGLGQLGVDRGIVEVGQSRRILRLMHGLGWVTVRFEIKEHRRVRFGLSPPTILRCIEYGPELS
jgi:hypothetical protein